MRQLVIDIFYVQCADLNASVRQLPANPLVKHQEGAQVDTALESREIGEDTVPVPPIRAPGTSRELVRRLLAARDEAKEVLSGYLGLREGEALVEMLAVSKGAVVGFKDVRPKGFKN